MKIRKKIKWMALNLIGLGVALGSSVGTNIAGAQDLIVSGGDTVTQDVVGTPRNTDNVQVDQSSTWQGNLSAEQGGGAGVEISENSTWEGDVSLNSGYAQVQLTDSTWNGDIYTVGDLQNSHSADISMMLQNSQRTGNAIVEEGGFRASLEKSSLSGDVQVINGSSNMSFGDYSTWEGDLSFIGTNQNYVSGYMDINSYSTWTGDATISLQNTAQNGNYNASIYNNSLWQGNVHVDASDEIQNLGIYTSIGVYENSRWIGNADVNGAFHTSLGANSHWIGNVKVENGENASSSGNYISIYDSSSWQGSMDLIHNNTSYMVSTYLGLGQSSQWIGNFKATGNVASTLSIYDNSVWQGNLELNYQNYDPNYISPIYINMGENSQWRGNLKTTGNVVTHASIYGNSLWVGDLDISQNTMGEEFNGLEVGEISLEAHSIWQGKIISGDSKSIGLNMNTESSWNVAGNSRLSYLHTSDSGISFVPKGNGTFSNLTVDGDFYSFNTLYAMNTDLATNQGDLLILNGGIYGENNLIQVNNQGDAWVDPEQELTIIKSREGADADYFTLSHAVEVGGFEYGMKQVGNDWVLYSDDRRPEEEGGAGGLRPTQPAQGGVKLFEGSYLLNYAETQTLMQRMGELRSSEDKQGIWARVYGGKFTSSGRGFMDGYKMNYTGLQVGRDKKFDLGENKGNIYFGGMFGYGKGSLDYKSGSGNVDSKTLGLYGTYVNPNGFYADAVLKYNWMNNDYKVLDSAGTPVKGDDINTDGVHFSLEVGQRIHLDR